MAQTSRPCDGCGTAVPRTSPTAPIPRYCGDDCKPRCSVEGCDGARRKRGWCGSHYVMWRAKGYVEPFGRKWAEPVPCKVCGSPPAYGYREFCGGTCKALWVFYDGNVPTEKPCLGCGVAIDLTARGRKGQRIHSVIVFCKRCKGEFNKYALTTQQLAERDGTDCGICGEPVDMDLRRYAPGGLMCASVDHVLPRARGGTHDPENLQLAHLRCNMVKSDRVASSVA